MTLKPWYKVVTPREDLRDGKPFDASEFAVHLDQVQEGHAPEVYQNPSKFFERTYLTKSLQELVCEVLKRLSGDNVHTNAIYNLSTQFGGGKTHSLTLLYHLAKNGANARAWHGMPMVLAQSGLQDIPNTRVAVFIGRGFDVMNGKGDAKELHRNTPWGDLAYQLGGEKAFEIVAKHDKELTAPSTDVIRKIIPKDKPVLILMDEVMDYVGRALNVKAGETRETTLASQFYSFICNLAEVATSQEKICLVVSLPRSEMEMSQEEEVIFARINKFLNRTSKSYILSEGMEIPEIVRRRLFEWTELPADGKKAAEEYAKWVVEHRNQLPTWFPVDNAKEQFKATYPFHPTVLSVFERKWQTLPHFQKTRGILKILALWVSKVYSEGYRDANKEALITLGTAPLEDPLFRIALFEQIGERELEAAVTTDITGKKESHSVRLDQEAIDVIKKSRLHQKVATTIFFESNGGQVRAEATIPEIRLVVGAPDIDIGNIETALEEFYSASYYVRNENNRYKFSKNPTLKKLAADRQASVTKEKIDECIKAEIQRVFNTRSSMELIFFPEKSEEIPDKPVLLLVVLDPDQSVKEEKTKKLIDSMTREHGSSGRTYKSALIWSVPEDSSQLKAEARKYLAWDALSDERESMHIDKSQENELDTNLKKSQRDLKEYVWKTYRHIFLLDKNNEWKDIDLGHVHSSTSDSLMTLIITWLEQNGELVKAVSPNFIARNWPPALTEWSTKSVRDAFFASPKFYRLLNPESIKETISKGVSAGEFAYVGKKIDGKYEPFHYLKTLSSMEIEITDDMFLIKKEIAQAYNPSAPSIEPPKPEDGLGSPEPRPDEGVETLERYSSIKWDGEVPPQKWMNFYTKILSKFVATTSRLKLKIGFEIESNEGLSKQQVEETKSALRELGMDENLEKKKK